MSLNVKYSLSSVRNSFLSVLFIHLQKISTNDQDFSFLPRNVAKGFVSFHFYLILVTSEPFMMRRQKPSRNTDVTRNLTYFITNHFSIYKNGLTLLK